jgi:hypothetical protein
MLTRQAYVRVFNFTNSDIDTITRFLFLSRVSTAITLWQWRQIVLKRRGNQLTRDIDWLGVCTAKPLWVRVYRVSDTKNSMLGTNKSGHLGDPVSYKLATLIRLLFLFHCVIRFQIFFLGHTLYIYFFKGSIDLLNLPIKKNDRVLFSTFLHLATPFFL